MQNSSYELLLCVFDVRISTFHSSAQNLGPWGIEQGPGDGPLRFVFVPSKI